jgi:integrase
MTRGAIAACAIAVEQVRRGEVRATSDTFGDFWAKLLDAKRPYVTAGTLQAYFTHGRKRLLPWFGGLRLTAIDEDRVRNWLSEMAEMVADGELSAKTVNNARTCLSMTLGEAVRRRHLPVNPCRYVPELPVERTEIDYLRLDEIDRYLDACADRYRALAELLIGTGAHISEALAARWPSTSTSSASRASARETRTGRRRPRASDSVRPRSARAWSRRYEAFAKSVAVPAWTTAAGYFSAPLRVAAATQPGPSPRRRAARPRTTGTNGRSRTHAFATCHSTRFATPPRPPGYRPATR